MGSMGLLLMLQQRARLRCLCVIEDIKQSQKYSEVSGIVDGKHGAADDAAAACKAEVPVC